jgi:hypothetical protein
MFGHQATQLNINLCLENNLNILVGNRDYNFPIFAAASLIRPAPVELPQDRKVARVNG